MCEADAFLYAVCWTGTEGREWQILSGGTTSCVLPIAGLASEGAQFAVSAVGRLGNESSRAVVSL